MPYPIDVPSVGASVATGVDASGVAMGVARTGDATGVALSGVAASGVRCGVGVADGTGATGVAAGLVGELVGVAPGVGTMIVGTMMPLEIVGIGVERGVLVIAGGVHSIAFSRDKPDGPPATTIPITALAPIARSTTSQRVRFTSCPRHQIGCHNPLFAKDYAMFGAI